MAHQHYNHEDVMIISLDKRNVAIVKLIQHVMVCEGMDLEPRLGEIASMLRSTDLKLPLAIALAANAEVPICMSDPTTWRFEVPNFLTLNPRAFTSCVNSSVERIYHD